MSGALALPPGWVTARLDELFATITDGDHQPPPQAQTGVPFVVIGDIRDGFVDLSDARFVPWAYYKSLPAPKKPLAGDLLYTVTGSFGIPVVVSIDAPFCVQRHIAILKPDRATHVRFVALALSTNAALGQATAVATGTAQKTVGLARLRTITIPLAPTNEQQRIVEALDSLLSRLDAAVASLESAQRKLKAYRASVLKAAVGGRLVATEAELARRTGRPYEPADALLDRILKERRRRSEAAELAKMMAAGKTPKDDRWKQKYEPPVSPDSGDLASLPEGWSWCTVDQLAEVTGGLTKNAARDSGPQRYPYLRVANVYANRLDLREVKEIAVKDSELPRLLLQRGDLLVVEGNGSVDQIGRVALWDGSIDPAVHQNHVIKARFSRSPLERWVLTWLLSPDGRAAIEGVASSTSGLHTLSISKVQSLLVPLPPENEQARALEKVDQLLSVVDASTDGIDAGLRRCARLRQSVLRWAFEGALVDQDPNDEPAELLLDRIRAERAAVYAPPNVKRSRKLKAAS